jgi:uncharacterized delta-60 repeat protein
MKNKFINSAFIFVAIGLAFMPSFAASPGSLDSSFGVSGNTVLTSSSIFASGVGDIQVLENGGFYATLVNFNSNADFQIVRCKSDGTLDNTFGNNGIVSTDFGNTDRPFSIAIQKDGKVLVLGNSGDQLAIARYNFGGTLDTTFDTDGKMILTDTGFAPSIATKADGRIVVSATSTNGDLLLLQLNSDGSLDLTFDVDGRVTTNIEGIDSLLKFVIQSDGKIVAVGSAASGSKSLVVRYNTNGSLDSTFSGDGILIIDFFTDISGESLRDIAINPVNNAISVVGTANMNKLQVYRILTNGIFDTSFSGDGRFESSFDSFVNEVVIQSDGKIVTAGGLVNFGSSVSGILLLRLNTNGTLDTQFGNAGVSHLLRNENNTAGKQIALNGDKLIVGNRSTVPNVLGSFARINLSNTPTASSDFDGDGTTDTAVFRPSTRDWFILRSTDNTFAIFQFGLNGDVPIDGDFDGDGKSDLAIFRPSSGVWFFQRSSDGTTLGAQFGQTGDKPIPGDYDKDGKTDIAFFRPSTANWFVLRSSTNFSAFFGFQFGATGDIPLSSEQK